MTAKEYKESIRVWSDDAMRFAVSCCGSKEDGEDAVQEACLRLWQRRDDVPTDKAKSFIFTTAYNHLLAGFRHKKVEQRYHDETQATASRVAQPDTNFDLEEAIDRSLMRLPEVQRAILQLRDVEGYSYKEVGAILGIDEDKVAVYLFRARVSLRKQLNAMGYDR